MFIKSLNSDQAIQIKLCVCVLKHSHTRAIIPLSNRHKLVTGCSDRKQTREKETKHRCISVHTQYVYPPE